MRTHRIAVSDAAARDRSTLEFAKDADALTLSLFLPLAAQARDALSPILSQARGPVRTLYRKTILPCQGPSRGGSDTGLLPFPPQSVRSIVMTHCFQSNGH